MNGTVYVYKTSPKTLKSDVEKVLNTPDFQDFYPEKETFIKINANYDRDWPGCNTSRWFLDALLKDLKSMGFNNLKVIEGDLKLQPAVRTIGAIGIKDLLDKGGIPFTPIEDLPRGEYELPLILHDSQLSIASEIMGFSADEVPLLKLAVARGLEDSSSVKVVYHFVSIVVVTKNEEKHIKNCLESLMSLDYPKEKYEVIVVDGNSTDKTREIVRKYHVNLIIDREGGLAHSRNIGIKNAKGDYIASTDADCVVKEDWLKILVDSIQEAPEDVVAVGGPNLIFDMDPPFSKVIGYTQQTFFASGGAPQSYRINDRKYVLGIPNCNVLYKKDKLLEVGGFDNSLSIGEDAEINSRLTKSGYKYLYLPDAIVWHHQPDSLKKFITKMYLYGEAMAKLVRMRKVIRWYSFLPTFAMFALLVAYPLFIVFPSVIYVYLCGIVIYLIGLGISAVQVGQRYRSIRALLIFLLLPIQHFSYGVGFLKGILGGK